MVSVTQGFKLYAFINQMNGSDKYVKPKTKDRRHLYI